MAPVRCVALGAQRLRRRCATRFEKSSSTLANQEGLLPGWGRSYLGVRQNVTRAPAHDPHPNRGPEPSETTLRRASYARSVREARSPELAVIRSMQRLLLG